MPPISLPLTFNNSFWSQDHFRTGLQTLFDRLEDGCDEAEETLAFIQSASQSYTSLAQSLSTSPPPQTHPTTSTAASSLHTLTEALLAQGDVYRSTALALDRSVAAPLGRWSKAHRVRVGDAREYFVGLGARGRGHGEQGTVIGEYEADVLGVAKLKQAYLVKARIADDAEEDARFAPSSASITSPQSADHLTPLPNKRLSDLKSSSPASLRRSGTVADRISEKLRQASLNNLAGATSPTDNAGNFASRPVPAAQRTTPSRISGLGLGLPGFSSGSAAGSGKQPILLAGQDIPFESIIAILSRFAHYLAVSSPPSSAKDEVDAEDLGSTSRTRTTATGTFDHTFSGNEFVAYLVENIEALRGELDRGEEAAIDLLAWGMIARAGPGRGWESSPDVYYILKDSATDSSPFAIEALRNHIMFELARAPAYTPSSHNTSGASSSAAVVTNMMKSYLPTSLSSLASGSPANNEPAHIRSRREAKKADEEYREAVERLDVTRLRIEEQIENGLRLWEKWERERMGVVRTVFKQYGDIVQDLPSRLQKAIQSLAVAAEACRPEADITSLIQNNRTGPFRPNAHVYEPLDSEELDVAFGIDLRKWAGEQGWKSMVHSGQQQNGEPTKGAIPEVLKAMLDGLQELSKDVPDDEKRKAWIYEVPLTETHRLREVINDPRLPANEIHSEVMRFNPPIVAATIKLWLLELHPPVLNYDLYDLCASIYPAVGADGSDDKTAQVQNLLSKLPGAQLFVLNAVIDHLRRLIDSSKTDEDTEVYITKLSLSVGRTLIRPEIETEITTQSRVPSLLIADLIRQYDSLFPTLVKRKKAEGERIMPVRKRTKPMDRRISRSAIEEGGDGKQLLEKQLAMQRSPPVSEIRPASQVLEHTATATLQSEPRQRISLSDKPMASPVASEFPESAKSPSEPKRVALQDPPVATETRHRVTLSDFPVPIASPIADMPMRPMSSGFNRTDENALQDLIDSHQASDHDIGTSEEGHGSGAGRFARQRQVAREDRPISETEASLSRSGSGENARVKGPRGARPRPPTGRVTSASLANIHEGNGNTIKDRIAKMEGRT